VLRAFKFGRIEALGASFAAAAWDRHAAALTAADCLVAIPLPWTRRLARGFNQAEAIARPLARRLDRPLQAALVRSAAPPLAQRSAPERMRLARRTLKLERGVSLPPTVLMVDDVFTTGATLRAASRLLRRAGARRLLALTPFWTPGPPTSSLER
jgi:predicted amidophosphoribosyltransferase